MFVIVLCCMSEISNDSVQSWIDKNDVCCGDCGESVLTVLSVEEESLISGEFDDLSPYVAILECDECGAETSNRLKTTVVKSIRK